MSTPAPGGSGDGGDRPKGFQRFMRRASTVLRRDKSKRQSVSAAVAPAPVGEEGATSSTTAPATAAASTGPSTEAAAAPPTTEPKTETKEPEPATATPQPKAKKTAADSQKILEEKARALFAKYNITLEEGEWTTPFKEDAARIEKVVRLRIKRHCHRCQTSFGVEKVCGSCGHNRCKRCPKTGSSTRKDAKGKVSITYGSIVVDDGYKALISMDPLAMPYRRSTKELVSPSSYKRTCHKCQSAFLGNAPQCGQCGHTRCAQCPQEPPTRGAVSSDTNLPRRRQLRTMRLRIRHTCHECQKTFRDLEKDCSKCGHAKCDKCPSDPGLDVKGPALDADALKSVEERLRTMEVSSQATAA